MAAFTALALGSLAFGAYNQIRAGQSAKKAGEAERRAAEASADLAEYNAAVADLQATDAAARGAAADVQADAAFQGELDALTIRTNAAREAWGYQVQAEDLRTRATIAREEGVMLEAAGRERRTSAIAGAG